MKIRLFLVLVVLSLSSSAWAFDSSRKGVVLGGGVGITPYVWWSVSNSYLGTYDTSETEVGITGMAMAGLAWDEHNLIVYQANLTVYKSDYFASPSGRRSMRDLTHLAAWYHYFGKVGRSVFTSVGVGFYAFHPSGLDISRARGAVMVGGGYEFARHLQAGLFVLGGKTSGQGFDYKHAQISAMITGLVY